jgi:hypothetical protein
VRHRVELLGVGASQQLEEHAAGRGRFHTSMAETLSDAFDFWGGHYNKVVNGLAATVGVDAHASGLTSKPLRERRSGPPTGLEFASCLTTDGGLVMVQDLPPAQASAHSRDGVCSVTLLCIACLHLDSA